MPVAQDGSHASLAKPALCRKQGCGAAPESAAGLPGSLSHCPHAESCRHLSRPAEKVARCLPLSPGCAVCSVGCVAMCSHPCAWYHMLSAATTAPHSRGSAHSPPLPLPLLLHSCRGQAEKENGARKGPPGSSHSPRHRSS